jgi:hypothetical protein
MRARELEYILCDDWFIFMYDKKTKRVHMFNTELMLEWGHFPEEENTSPGR